MSYKDNDKEWERIQNRDIVETMRYNKADELLKNFLKSFFLDIKLG